MQSYIRNVDRVAHYAYLLHFVGAMKNLTTSSRPGMAFAFKYFKEASIQLGASASEMRLPNLERE